jgi:hypothetical protein
MSTPKRRQGILSLSSWNDGIELSAKESTRPRENLLWVAFLLHPHHRNRLKEDECVMVLTAANLLPKRFATEALVNSGRFQSLRV